MGLSPRELPPERYNEPVCPKAEKNFWNDFTQRLVMAHEGLVLPQADVATLSHYLGRDEKFPVVWKQKGFGDETAIALDGDYAGHIVEHAYQIEDESRVVIGRVITLNGGIFDSIKAQNHIKGLNIPDSQRNTLLGELQKEIVDYPKILATILEWLHYPINTPLFLENIRLATVVYVPGKKVVET